MSDINTSKEDIQRLDSSYFNSMLVKDIPNLINKNNWRILKNQEVSIKNYFLWKKRSKVLGMKC